jgi:enoyl-CoA hydratase
MKQKEVLYSVKEGIARIVINRPEKKNALNIRTRQTLVEIMDEVARDGNIQIVVITGSGEEAFISGADLNEMKDLTALQMLRYIDTYGQKLYNKFDQLPIPTIALVKGYCLGGGCELAIACDIRIASPDATFALPELKHGVIPGGGGTQRLGRLVGIGRAKEIILTGRLIDATEAEKIGLINKVVPKDQIEDYVTDMAKKIVSQGPIAVRMAKVALNESLQGSLSSGMMIEAFAEAVCYSTRDKQEGFEAFLQKRKPKFTDE